MRRYVLLLLLLGCKLMYAVKVSYPFENKEYSVEQRVDDLLGRMTLEEKIAQISHLHSWNIFDGQQLNMDKLKKAVGATGIGFFEGFPLTADNCKDAFRVIQNYLITNTRLGIPAFPVAESLHGVVHEGATIFPQNIALGSTFNPLLAYDKTRHISGELHTIGIGQVLSPCIDVVRDLRWGRVEESFGEDPFLCGRMGVAEVSGYLDNGISPMIKHYGPHGNPVGGLNLASVECGIRDLFDIYLKPFETVILETNVMAVMSSYNSWNRIPNSASRFMLTDILRDKFGFRGYVYSDWGAVDMLKTFHKTAANDFEAAKQALMAGLDVEASSSCFSTLAAEIRKGNFDIAVLDRAVRRVLCAKFEMGLFDDPFLEKRGTGIPLRSSESIDVARRIADESTVLLKNEKGILPLSFEKIKSIAVIGPNADQVQFGDYTWSKNNSDGVTPLQGLKRLVEGKVQINYAQGCPLVARDTSGFPKAVEAVKKSDVALIFVGSSSTTFVRNSKEPSVCGEGIDLHDIILPGVQEKLIKEIYALGKPVVVILVTGKPFAIPWIKKNVPAILVQWYAGEQAGNSIADILFGKVVPSGKLNFSFPQSTGHLPVYYNYLPTDKGFYKEPGSYDKPGRDYVFSTPDPLWPFGYGLSYTSFDYLKVSTDKEYYSPYDTIRVKVQLKNTGRFEGKEVIQVYVRDLVSSVVTPIKQLKGFLKIKLMPGEIKEGEINIPVKELFLTRNSGERFLEPGDFEIQVGTSSEQIYHYLTISVGEKRTQQQAQRPVENTHGVSRSKKTCIRGVVRDVQATPVPNVKVVIAGTDTSVETDRNGYYEICTEDNSVISFLKEGFATENVKIGRQKTINIRMTRTY